MKSILWEASEARKQKTNLHRYLQFLQVLSERTEDKKNPNFENYSELHSWSVNEASAFWTSLFEFFHPLYEGSLTPAFHSRDFLDYTWFPNIRLNFAENLLRSALREEPGSPHDGNRTALNFWHESGLNTKYTYHELKEKVRSLQYYLKNFIAPGDVVAAYMPNIPETAMAMLATSSLGGVFTSTSSDFGIQGVIDRFGQTEPKILFAATGYTYNGKYFDQREKIQEIKAKLPSVQKIILVDFLGDSEGNDNEDGEISLNQIFQTPLPTNYLLSFQRLPFKAPLYIMYSSGTTGKPKCIVHSVGGTLLQHIKELGLHSDLTAEKSLFFFTTCGWMMWNWLLSGLFFGSEIVLYEGSPAFPSLADFMEILSKEKIKIFGTSPKFLRALEKENLSFSEGKFPCLETILSTGSPLLPEQYDFVYQKIKKDVLLSSISGGTDIIGCFMLGNPLLPVSRGEIQCLGLGMDVAAYNENGQAVIDQEGELVCRQNFPSTPIGFWNDPDQKLFKAAYFERFPGVWHHGDFIKISPEQTVQVFGRSDATLNPGGVRIGTAEIYRQTEKLPYVEDALSVGRELPDHEDVEVVLFVKLRPNEILTETRQEEIKKLIRQNTTPRHVPAQIWQIKDIPYTRSGKKMELLISRLLNHRPSTNLEAVANPECLQEYEQYISQKSQNSQ